MGKIIQKSSWNYSSALESTDHIVLKKQYDLFINGDFIKSNSKKYFNSVNPATDEIVARISEGNKNDVDLAVSSARKAFKSWSKFHPKERVFLAWMILQKKQLRSYQFDLLELYLNLLQMNLSLVQP